MWGIHLDRQSELPLRRQIYQALVDQMIGGKLKAGELLPSTRELAKGLNVSRNTVSDAYEMLIAEGFVISSQGAPTRIAEGLCVEKMPDPIPRTAPHFARVFSTNFRTGLPDLRQFPRFLWQQMLTKASEEMTPEHYGYTGAQGIPELRKEIALWLYRNRGLSVDDGDIFITQGATHALHLIAELICGDRQEILMEDPCHTGMLHTFLNKGVSVIPIPADEHGIQTEGLKDRKAGAVYVTPSHQFPLGGILPASRRAALIRFAHDKEAFIIEDDYDSEFRYCGEPIAPLFAMDSRRVIYVGTFSKSVYPALRIGYVILPGQLQERWLQLRTYTDVQSPISEQMALMMFLRTRKMDRHIKRMRRIYGERRSILLEALTQTYEGEWHAFGDDAGLHLAVEFPGLHFDDAFRKSGQEKGINLTPVEHHCIEKGRHQSKLLIGYGHLEPAEIRSGITLLCRHIKEYFGSETGMAKEGL